MTNPERRVDEPTHISQGLKAELERIDSLSPEEKAEHHRQLRLERAASTPIIEPTPTRWPEIPERYEKATIDNYVPENVSETAAQKAAAKWVSKACGKQGGVMLALLGSTGVGKSHLLWGASTALREANQPHYARPWYNLADELRWGGAHPWTGAVEEATLCRHAMWHSRRVVLLDEIDHTSGTDFDRVELKKFAHHAYDHRLSVLITSPVQPLAEVIGVQAASRFVQIVVEGRDRRAPK